MMKKFTVMYISITILVLVIIILLSRFYIFNQIRSSMMKYGEQNVTIFNVDKNKVGDYKLDEIIKEIDTINIYSYYQENNKTIYIGAFDNYNLSHIKILEGHLPNNNNEIAICKSALEYINSSKAIGDYIDINNYIQGEYLIVGIVDDFLDTNLTYSLNETNTQRMPDAIIKYDVSLKTITTNVLIQFKNNIDSDDISKYLYKNSLSNYQLNTSVYDSNNGIINKIDQRVINTINIIIISIIIIFIFTLLYFNIGQIKIIEFLKSHFNVKLSFKSCIVQIFLCLFFINLLSISGIKIINEIYQANKITSYGDYVISKTAELSTGALNIPINLYDGLSKKQYSEIQNNKAITEILSVKTMPMNIIDINSENYFKDKVGSNSTDFKQYKNELEKYNYNINDNIYMSYICFLNNDELNEIGEYNNIKIDLNKLNSGNGFVILKKADAQTLKIGDCIHFTQIIHSFNQDDYKRIDFDSKLEYILYLPPKFYDLFYYESNIVMSSEFLSLLGLDLPYTAISISESSSNNNELEDLLESIEKYKGNSSIDYYSKNEQSIRLMNIMVNSWIILISSLIFFIISCITIFYYQKKKITDEKAGVVKIIINNILTEFGILELFSLGVSIIVYELLTEFKIFM